MRPSIEPRYRPTAPIQSLSPPLWKGLAMTFSRSCRFALLWTCTAAAAAAGGCAEPKAEVSGTITFRGQAPNLKGLDIGFLGGNGRLVTATINDDGTYKAIGVPVGEVAVSFIYSPLDPEQVQKKSRLIRPGPNGPPAVPNAAMNPASKNPIPVPLRDGSTSKLTFKVAPGPNNVFNYDVKP